ncbi:baeRF2 domain-containing protein [Cellulomonas alba]|uniref:Peptide chain release factor 1 n=1 Tax=Cellulomonas alba TaxID=3053467 RepID=A0ABT7SIL5_9CELL|nr:hypothetical protein [Cellulomonas alba]MDM7856027.1 hypothetical protein [Cellulomonas alba]
MDLHWLKPLLGRPSPFVTVYLDVTRAEAAGEAEAADRWRGLRRGLERDGASAAVLDEIGDRVAVPTGVRRPHGRVVVADAHGVVVDRVLLQPPAQSTAEVGPAPALLPAVRAADETVAYLVVVVDRNGADLAWKTSDSGHGPSRREVVEGGHDDVHKTREGSLARRGQTRAEDSWERNAEAVARAVEHAVAEDAFDVVVLTGDVRAVALVKEELGRPALDVVVEVPGGARGEGARGDVFEARVAEALEAVRERRRAEVLDRFREAQGRGEGAVTALEDVIEVLRRGQVAELVVHVDALAGGLGDRELFVGPEPLQLASSASDLAALGVSGAPRTMAAGVALLRAAIGQDAGVTFADDGSVDLVDGIGAVLRWSDGSTPSEAVPTQSADQRRLRTVI